MNFAHTGHTATVLSSTTGTIACPTSSATNSCVLIAGGNPTAGQTWEIYDPLNDAFLTTASVGHDLVDPQRSLHAAAAFVNGKVLLAGGSNGTSALGTSEVFDPNAATLGFVTGPGLQLARVRAAAAYAGAQDVLVLVGGNSVGPSTEQVTAP